MHDKACCILLVLWIKMAYWTIIQNAQLEKELELMRREHEEKEREWETENTELKNEVWEPGNYITH